MRSKCPYCESTRGIKYVAIGEEHDWVQKEWRCESCKKVVAITESPNKKVKRKLRRL